MVKPEDRHRVGTARLLRRQGNTYNEIRAVIGYVTKPGLRKEVRRLRGAGLTIAEIAAATGASKGSISPWVRDSFVHPRVLQKRAERLQKLRGRGGRVLSDRARQRRELVGDSAYLQVRALAPRELFVIGVALYWAEGGKDKPWRRQGRVRIINSAPSVLRIFWKWLDLLGVPEADRQYRLNIHETADVATQEQWWQASLVCLPTGSNW